MTAPQLSTAPQRSVGFPRAKTQTLFAILFYLMAFFTLGLMALGSSTRVMNAGLSCPDWPLCFGTLVPAQQMNLQVFLEWFHRLVASSIGFAMIAMNGAVILYRRRLPNWLPFATLGSLGLVVFQGVLGGLTVTQLLRFDIVTAHLATGLLFFSSLLAIATGLVDYQGTGAVGKLPWLGSVAVVCIYGQSVLGALVASRWAAHQCLADSQLCHVLSRHYWGVLPATISVLLLIGLAWKTPALHPWLRRATFASGGLLLLQVTLGLSTLKFHLQLVALTVAHQMVGATLLGVCLFFTLIAWRDRSMQNSLSNQENPVDSNLPMSGI